MSSILKALKKLEEEKAAKQNQRVDITKDIFGAAQQPAQGRRWPLIAAGAAGVVVFGVSAFFFMTRPTTKLTSVPMPVETPQNKAMPSLPPGDEIRPADKEAAPIAPLPDPTRIVPAAAPKPAPAKPKNPPPVLEKPAKAPHSSTPAPVISANHPVISNPPAVPQQVKPAAPVAAVPPSVPATAPLAKITVSGIAYNTAPADRLAIINGTPLTEGKSISGVKVEEIMPDKVRFSSGQKSFEVLLGRSNQ